MFGSAEGDMAAVMRALGIEPDPPWVRELTRRHLELLAGRTHLYDDVLPVLRELRAGGVRTAIISNCDHWTRPVLDRLGLDVAVDTVLLSFEIGVMKPNGEIYDMALDRVGVEPSEAVFVDDVVEYLDGAAALGIRTLHIVRDGGAYPPAEQHATVRDLRAVL